MTMLSLRRPTAKLHLPAATRREARPFGEGILPPERPALDIKGIPYYVQTTPGADGERVVRLSSAIDPAGVYDVSRGPDGLVACDCPDYTWKRQGTATMCKHGRACVEAGLVDAPAPVANPGCPDAIPARALRIRVVDGPSAGVWHRPASGDRWAFEGDDTGRWLAAAVADDWYRAGRVAILADRPATAPAPEPAPADEGDVEGDPATWPAWTDDRWTPADLPIDPGPPKVSTKLTPFTAADLAFEAGRAVALDCDGPVEAPARYTPAERTMFLAGLAEGAAIAHARELARLDALELQASYDHGEWAEARMPLPAAVAMD